MPLGLFMIHSNELCSCVGSPIIFLNPVQEITEKILTALTRRSSSHRYTIALTLGCTDTRDFQNAIVSNLISADNIVEDNRSQVFIRRFQLAAIAGCQRWLFRQPHNPDDTTVTRFCRVVRAYQPDRMWPKRQRPASVVCSGAEMAGHCRAAVYRAMLRD